MSNLTSLPHPSLRILNKTQTGVFSIPDFWSNILQTRIAMTLEQLMIFDMKFGPVTKLDKGNSGTSCWQIMTALSFWQL